MQSQPRTPLTPFIGTKSPRILVADQDPVGQQTLKSQLEKWRCRVEVASSGAQARAVARKFNPDLILLDVVMPDQSGFAVCEALQADPATKHIRVIFISALSGTPAKVMGFETGGHDYLTKPFNPGELAARVGAHLREKYVEDELREKQTKLAALMDPSSQKPRPT